MDNEYNNSVNNFELKNNYNQYYFIYQKQTITKRKNYQLSIIHSKTIHQINYQLSII